MKHIVTTLALIITTSLAVDAQEMESLIFNETDIHLNLTPDTLGGSSEISLQRRGNYEDAIINFQYRDDPYTFGEIVSGGTSSWKLGVNDVPDSIGDFSLTNYHLDFDALLIRKDITVRNDNGFMGIGVYNRPLARLDIDHLSQSINEPALNIGANCSTCAYTNIHKYKFDDTDGISEWSHNGTWATRINDNGDFHRLEVNGNVYSSTGNYFGPFIILGRQNKSDELFSDRLGNLKVVNSNAKSTNMQYGLDAISMQKAFPSLVQKEDKVQGVVGGVNYVGLIPVMVAAHQETVEELAAAKNEIADLKERLERLEALIK